VKFGKRYLWGMLLVSVFVNTLPGHAACSDSSACYGSGLGSDGLANTVVGGQWGNIVSYRFRAGHSGSLQQIHVYLIPNHTGYSGGTGGQIQVTVNADDGTSTHNPSSTVLASYLLSNPLAATPSINFPIFVFSVPPTLVQGQLYHIVFTNVDPSPTINYLSVDALYLANPSTPAQPTISDVDAAELLGGPSGTWTQRKGYTPILELDYQDGSSELIGYMEVWVGAPQSISGASAVRETITVTGAQKTVSSASIRVARTSGTDPLIVRLENSDGTLIEEGEIPASSIPLTSSVSYAWATFTFSSAHTLLAGQNYHLQLSAASTSSYQAYPIRKGVAYGFRNTTYFPDGYAQFNQSGSWVGWTQWGVSNRTDGDLQFYFGLAPASTAAPTISNVLAGSLTANSATITWTTDQSSSSQVEYGTATAYGNLSTVDANVVTAHSQVIKGLVDSTLYHYRVHSTNATANEAISGDFTFTTSSQPLTIGTASLPDGTQSVAYSATLAVTGGTTPYSWSIISGTLPAGLALAANTGVISGTPTVSGPSNFTVQVTDSNSLTASKPLSLTVTATSSLTVTTTSLPDGTQNVSYSATLAAGGGTAPYTWSIISGTLPAGLTLTPNTGVISGTPTVSGTSNFTVQVTDSNSLTATKSLSLAVVASTPPPTVTTTSLPSGTQNVSYSITLAATGGTAPYTWSIISGTLPAGLALAANTGVISGTPTGSGTSNFTVQVTDANSLTASKPLSLAVTASIPPPAVSTTSLPSGTQNVPYSATLAATGGTTPYVWSIISGTLPAGLALAVNTGLISGTPTVSGTSNFTVQVTDANLLTASKPLSLAVTASIPLPVVTTTSLLSGAQNVAYSAMLAATGGTVPYTWSIFSGILPAGLTLTSNTGVISGTPTGNGTSNFTVQVTDVNLMTASKTLSLTVTASIPPPVVTTTTLPNGTQNVAYSATLAATGGTAPYSWSIISGTLPAGLALAANTGVISGTPAGSGTISFTVQVTDANLRSASKALSLTITASGGGGGIGLVQANAARWAGVGSLSVAFPTTNSSGNLIIAFVRMSTTSQTVTLSDSAGNTYVQAVSQVQNADGSQIRLFYARNILGRANTVKATFSSANNHPWLAIYEYKGLNTNNPLDRTAHTQGRSTAPSSGATPTTTSANELIFSGFGFPANYSGSQTAGSGYTLIQNDKGGSAAANESRLVTATGSYAAAFNLGSSVNWCAVIATFKQ
jgi:hypothetical protein